MKRYVSMEEISDGKLYRAQDMVKADCLGCRGCWKCCQGMGESILLDPLDIWRLEQGLGRGLSALMEEGRVALRVVDGVILPYLKMVGRQEACSFLGPDGRCTIHSLRPGFCRLFPLGRVYDEDGDFRYFLQTSECDHPKAKIKVEKWLDTPGLKLYEDYIRSWHGLQTELRHGMESRADDEYNKRINMSLLSFFYLTPYESNEEFYSQFADRLAHFRKNI